MTEREQILAQAREIEPNFEQEVLNVEGPGKFEGNQDRELALAVYIISLAGGSDDEAGSTERGLHGSRVGSYILWEDDRGFDTLDEYENQLEAEHALAREDERQNPEAGELC